MSSNKLFNSSWKSCFYRVSVVFLILALGVLTYVISKKSKNVINELKLDRGASIQEIKEYIKMESEFIVKNIKKNIPCEFFSEAVGVCNAECTLTSYETILAQSFFDMVSPSMKVLEIGPYVNPSLKGANVKYFDILSAEDIKSQILNEKNEALKNGVSKDADLSKVPNIDYVHPNGDLRIIKEKFDVAFSSHNIEHQIDLVAHLNQVAELLNSGGKFYLVIPDKRYCFDHFIPESPLSDIIGSYYSAIKLHQLDTILAMSCETTHNNPKLHWQGEHGQVKGRNSSCYVDSIKDFKNNSGYINAHRWRFTPQSFEFIINQLNEMGLTTLKVEKVYMTQENTADFKVILYKP